MKVVICDNEIFIKKARVRQYLENLYLKIESSATYIQKQNRFIKRLRNIIKKKRMRLKKKQTFLQLHGLKLIIQLFIFIIKYLIIFLTGKYFINISIYLQL